MQGSKLRRATAADAANVRALTRAAYAKWVPVIGREPLRMTADYDLAVVEHIIDLLEEDGQLLALIEVIPKATHLLSKTLRFDPINKERDTVLSFCITPKGSHVLWDLLKSGFTPMRRLPRTWHSIPGAGTENFCERPWCLAARLFT
jgi:hypothetical protein